MPLNESASGVASLLLSVLTFSALQVLKPALTASKAATVAGGALASLVFLFALTALSNLEKAALGRHFASRWPEVAVSLALAAASAASVHRVCATTCVGFSLALLHGMSKISQETYEGDGSSAAGGGSGASGSGGDGGARGKKKK